MGLYIKEGKTFLIDKQLDSILIDGLNKGDFSNDPILLSITKVFDFYDKVRSQLDEKDKQ